MLSATGVCEFCDKYIEQEATRRRHYYYCRAKQSDPGPPKKRACETCVASKARCDLSMPRCYRCEKRNQHCSYEVWEGSALSVPVVRAVTPSREFERPPSVENSLMRKGHRKLTRRLSKEVKSQRLEFHIAPGSEVLRSEASFSPRYDEHGTKGPRFAAVVLFLEDFLRGYRDGSKLPPFIHWSQLVRNYGSARSSFETCQSLLRSFFAPNADKATVWMAIQTECDRIWFNCEQFDAWELLSSMQTFLLFAILRSIDGPPPITDFDLPFLVAISQIARSVASRADDPRFKQVPDIEVVRYEKWAFQEAHRRTVCVYRALNMVYDLSEAVCMPMPGYFMMPLPMPEELWSSTKPEHWALQFDTVRQERSMFGLDVRGRLMKLHVEGDSTISTEHSWPAWCGDGGQVGYLIAAAAILMW